MELCYPLRKWIVPTEVVILGGFGSSAMEIVIPVRRKDGIGPSGKSQTNSTITNGNSNPTPKWIMPNLSTDPSRNSIIRDRRTNSVGKWVFSSGRSDPKRNWIIWNRRSNPDTSGLSQTEVGLSEVRGLS